MGDEDQILTEAAHEQGALADTAAAFKELSEKAEKAPKETPGTNGKAEAGASQESAAAEPAPKPAKEAKPERARGPDGKFAKGEIAAGVEADPAAAVDPQEPAETPDGPQAPAHWPQLEKDRFAALPKEAKPIVLDKVTSLEKGYQQKFNQVAAIAQEAQALDQIFQPLQGELAQARVSRPQAIQRLVSAHIGLSGPSKAQVAAKILQDYGIDPVQLAAAMGAQQAPSQPGTGEADAWLDPMAQRETQRLSQQLSPLADRLGKIEEAHQQNLRTAQESQQREIAARILSFKDAKAADGSLAHPYFEDVRPAMAHLMDMVDAQGQRLYPTLDAAYEAASRLNPEISAAQAKKSQEDAAKKLAAERRADVARAAAAQAAPSAAQPHQARRDPAPKPKRDNPMNDAREAMAELRAGRIQ